MYDHIEGEVVERAGSRVVLRAHGVGYELKVSLNTAGSLEPGRAAVLFTILHVVDGTPSLLGFATRGERELARKLLQTSGVGPAIALSILSLYAPGEVAAALASSDVAALKRVKGVGQKTAERLCLELRDSVRRIDFGAGEIRAAAQSPPVVEDAIAALVTLGFSDKEARDKVGRARAVRPELATASTEELVKAVLQL